MTKRIVIGMTGATGAIYGFRILQVLRQLPEWESHLIISDAGVLNIQHELGIKKSVLTELADKSYSINEIGSAIASGAFKTAGMMVVPCSMKTLASIANGFSDNLISRAADVTLKERRRLLVVPRETPLNLAHIRNMEAVTEMGGIIYPPMPAFYGQAKTVESLVDETVGRLLDWFGIDSGLYQPWEGV